MSTAARAVSRGAGRGTSLAPSPRPMPVTQFPNRRQGPVTRSAGRGTLLNGELPTERTSLTSSILRRRHPAKGDQSQYQRRRDSRHGNSHMNPRYENQRYENQHYENPTSRGRADANSKRKIEDWYNSAARREALAGLAQATSELEEASKRPGNAKDATQPFAWADLSDVVNQLPEGHWAYGYVSEVANSIELNDAMDGKQKEKILGEVLEALGRLSRQNDERYQDAES